MPDILVCGARTLHGTVRVPGAKNAVLPILAASLLAQQPCEIHNVPRLADVDAALAILQAVGAKAQLSQGVVYTAPANGFCSQVPAALASTMRSSVFFAAPLLARTGSAQLGLPGGCPLGARPVDIHLDGLVHMGAQTQQNDTCISLCAARGLHGADYTLRFPSVGATETLLMAATTAHGVTVLRGVAQEPEIVDLARFLRACGARIAGEGTHTLRIQGVQALHGATHTVCPDRITAATLLCAVAGCGGEVDLQSCDVPALRALLRVLQRAGCTARLYTPSHICFARYVPLRAAGTWQSEVYPGLATDMLPLVAAAFLRAQGAMQLTDTVFGARFACAEGFRAMGAHTVLNGGTLTVHGVHTLHGAAVRGVDLRGGAALVLAALQAQGQSRVAGAHLIARGYEDICKLFSSLGASLRYDTAEQAETPSL